MKEFNTSADTIGNDIMYVLEVDAANKLIAEYKAKDAKLREEYSRRLMPHLVAIGKMSTTA